MVMKKMYKCRFYNKDKSNCTILANTKCSEKCKFRKTDTEFYEGIKHAEEILERKCLAPCVVHTTDKGDIMSTIKIK